MGHPPHACRICGWWGWIPMKATGAFRYMAGVGFLLYHFVIPPLARSHMIAAFSISENVQTKRKWGNRTREAGRDTGSNAKWLMRRS